MVIVTASVSGNQAKIQVTYGLGDAGLPQDWTVVINSKQDHGAGLSNLNYDYPYFVLQRDGTGTQSFILTLAPGDYLATLILANGAKPDYAIFGIGVTPPPTQVLTRIILTPVSVALPIGDVQIFTLTWLDQAGNLMSCGAVTWSVDNPAVGSITTTGMFTATSPGTTTVRVKSESITGTSSVTVAGPTCTPVWKCEQPLNGYEQDGCGNTRANARCNPVPNTGSLIIYSTPAGAEIFLDDADQGVKTPNAISSVPVGVHAYTLKLAGYNNYTGLVSIVQDQTTLVSAVLTSSGPSSGTALLVVAAIAAGLVALRVAAGRK